MKPITFLTAAALLGVSSAQLRGQSEHQARLVEVSTSNRILSVGQGSMMASKDEQSVPAPGQQTYPFEPLIPGIARGIDRPHITLAQDISYPPYAFLCTQPEFEEEQLCGFGVDFARSLNKVCDIDVTLIQTQWTRCWAGDRIGAGLASAEYHGCTTYTHTAGARNRFLEFSSPILEDNKAAGIITRLDEDGQPLVDGSSNLNGMRVVDVVGFAPTQDNLNLVTNSCTGDRFSGFTFVEAPTPTDDPNDDALRLLLAGEADVLWIYADQAEQYSCANASEDTPYNCTMWDRLGTDFAYIQTGMFDYSIAGTTLAISKLGSDLSTILNPCIDALVKTEAYYELCKRHSLVDDCFPNKFFPANISNTATAFFDLPTNALTTDCASGYCSCPIG